ncbi:MAG: glycosyltransferase family 4 protein [Betaproteobacteria bacterium]|nr:glycosyltransferase family 4 protein [Betaproteobacteria bacterium]
MNHANAAIYYEPEGYTTTGPKLMGRQAAGEGFLRGFIRHARLEAFFCYAARRSALQSFTRACEENSPAPRPVKWIPYQRLEQLAEPGTLYLPGPGLGGFAWRRRRVGAARYSLCGVTHTTASHTAMDAIAEMLTSPVEPWDALICTSQVVLESVRRLLDLEAEFLRERLKAQAFPRPTLSLIPLGADCEALAPREAARGAWRQRLGIGPDDVVFLFLGRLSFHAKANPLPMYLALEAAAARTRARLHLIQAGWFANEFVEGQFRDGARQFCPSVNAIFLDGRDPEVRRDIWQAADVFTSLVDNIQETFGLTPVEAMSAALPGVVSDWDGYRGTVREGIDGFRIPTCMAPAPLGADLAALHEDGRATYDHYIGHASQFISVDVASCAEAYARLANDPDLRRKMGAAARERALAEFDWPVVIARYQALWHELAEKRRGATPSAPARPGLANPRRTDPFWLFSGYPSTILGPGHRLALSPEASRERVELLRALPMMEYARPILPGEELCALILNWVAQQPGSTLAKLLESLPPAQHGAAMRAVMWLGKVDVLRISA